MTAVWHRINPFTLFLPERPSIISAPGDRAGTVYGQVSIIKIIKKNRSVPGINARTRLSWSDHPRIWDCQKASASGATWKPQALLRPGTFSATS